MQALNYVLGVQATLLPQTRKEVAVYREPVGLP